MPHRVTLTQQIFHIPGYIFLHTYPATRIVPPPRVLWSVELHQDNQARFVIPIYYVLTDQGGKLSCTWESFLLILNSYFLYNKMCIIIYFLPISSHKMCEASAEHILWHYYIKPIFRPKTTFRPNVKTPVSP